RDRSPPIHDHARRPHRGDGGRARDCDRHARGAARGEHALRGDRRQGAAAPRRRPQRPGRRRRPGRGGGGGRKLMRLVPRPPAGSSGRQRLRRLRGVAELLRPYRGRTIVAMVSLVLATAASLAPPYLAKLAIDDGITPGDLHALDLIVAAFVGSALLYWGATYLQTYLVGWVGQRALQDLRLRLFTHIQKQSIGFFSRRKTGVLISRMTNDIQALDQLVTDGVVTLFSSTLTLVGTVVILMALDVGLALVVFVATLPFLAIGSVAFRYFSAGAYRRVREKIANVTAYLQETLSGVRVVRAFGQERRHIDRFAELNEEHRTANMT